MINDIPPVTLPDAILPPALAYELGRDADPYGLRHYSLPPIVYHAPPQPFGTGQRPPRGGSVFYWDDR